jgi:hypothetical protein
MALACLHQDPLPLCRHRWRRGVEQIPPPHHKARMIEFLPKPLPELVRGALHNWELDNANKALRHQAPRRKLR